VINFVSDLQQVSGFLWALVCSTNKTDHHNITEILLKMELKHHDPNTSPPLPLRIELTEILGLNPFFC
jgi:hypothetical protein